MKRGKLYQFLYMVYFPFRKGCLKCKQHHMHGLNSVLMETCPLEVTSSKSGHPILHPWWRLWTHSVAHNQLSLLKDSRQRHSSRLRNGWMSNEPTSISQPYANGSEIAPRWLNIQIWRSGAKIRFFEMFLKRKKTRKKKWMWAMCTRQSFRSWCIIQDCRNPYHLFMIMYSLRPFLQEASYNPFWKMF